MEAMREQWTDARLDDLNGRVSSGFDRIDADLRDIRGEIRSLRSEVKTEIGSLRSEMKTEIGSVHRLILQVAGGLFATFAVGFLGLIATQL